MIAVVQSSLTLRVVIVSAALLPLLSDDEIPPSPEGRGEKESSAAISAAAENELIFAKAVGSFQKGKARLDDAKAAREHFAEAAEFFAELTDRGVHSAGHFLNQGNAEFLAGKPAHAIYSYRRGLQLSPDHPTLQANLDFVRREIPYSDATRPPEDFWPLWLPAFSPVYIVWGALVFWIITLACFAIWLRTAGNVWRLTSLTALTLTLICSAHFAIRAWQIHQDSTKPLVVIARDKTPLHLGNGINYPLHPEASLLNAGLEARRLHTRGDWLQIQFASGTLGWIHKDAALGTEP